MADSLVPEALCVRSALGAMLTETTTGDEGVVLVTLATRVAPVTPDGSDNELS